MENDLLKKDELTNKPLDASLQPQAPAAPVVRDPSLPAVPGMNTAEMNAYAAQKGAEKPGGEVIKPAAEAQQPVIPTSEEYRAKQAEEVRAGGEITRQEISAADPDAKIKISAEKTVVTKPEGFVPGYDRWDGERAQEKVFERAGYNPFRAMEMSAVLTEYSKTGNLTTEALDVLSRLKAAATPKEQVVPAGYKGAGTKMEGVYEKPTVEQRNALAVAEKVETAMKLQMKQVEEKLKAGLSGQKFGSISDLNAAIDKIDPNGLRVVSLMERDMQQYEAKTGKPAPGWYADLIDPLKKDQKAQAEMAPKVMSALRASGFDEESARAVIEAKPGTAGAALFSEYVDDIKNFTSKGEPSRLPVKAPSGPSGAWDDSVKAKGTSEMGSRFDEKRLLDAARELYDDAKGKTPQEKAISAAQSAAEKLGLDITADRLTLDIAKPLHEERTGADARLAEVQAFKFQQSEVSKMADVKDSVASLRMTPAQTDNLFKTADMDGQDGVSFEEYVSAYAERSGADKKVVGDIIRSGVTPDRFHPDVSKLRGALFSQFTDAGVRQREKAIADKKETPEGKADLVNQLAGARLVIDKTGQSVGAQPGTAIPSPDGKMLYMSTKGFSQDVEAVRSNGNPRDMRILGRELSAGAGTPATGFLSNTDTLPVMVENVNEKDPKARSRLDFVVGEWGTKIIPPSVAAEAEKLAFKNEDEKDAFWLNLHKAGPTVNTLFEQGLTAINADGIIGTEKSGWVGARSRTEEEVAADKLAISSFAQMYANSTITTTGSTSRGTEKTTTKTENNPVEFMVASGVKAFSNLKTEEGARAWNTLTHDPLLGGPLILLLLEQKTAEGFEKASAIALNGLRAIAEKEAVNKVSEVSAKVLGELFAPGTPGQIEKDRDSIPMVMETNLRNISDHVTEEIGKMAFEERAELNEMHSTLIDELSGVKKSLESSINTLLGSGLPVGAYLTAALDKINLEIERVDRAAGTNADRLRETPYQKYYNEARNLGVGEMAASQIAQKKVSEDRASEIRAKQIRKQDISATLDGTKS